MDNYLGQMSLFADKQEKIIDDEFQIVFDDTIKVKEGDVFILGNHRLMCGDATNPEHVKKLMNNKKVDLFLTDPPYNVSYVGATKDKLTIQNDSLCDSEFRLFLKDSFQNANDVMKEGSSFYIFHADSEGYNFRGALRDVNLSLKQTLIWVKNALVMGRQDYQWKHEPILYGWKEGAPHNWYSDRKQTTTLEFDKPLKNELHPTMKPIELCIYLIKNSSKKHDIILDLFAGSGSTLLACEYTKRYGYMMELDPQYCNVIIQRYQKLTGLKYIKE